jgi:hypothetical protein
MLNYQDTDERKNILNELSTVDILDIIDKYYPDWVVHTTDKYCEEYSILSLNWKNLTKLLNTEPKKIILVSFISFENEYSILNKVCDFLTKNGYCVRRYDEFITCDKCNSAITSINVYNTMKNNNVKVPLVWKEKCIKCF